MSFYDDLVKGKEKRKLLSVENRFNPDKIANSPHITKYIDQIIKLIDPKNGGRILDYGCGNGSFTKYLSKHFSNVVGYDPSREFIHQAEEIFPDITFFTSVNEVKKIPKFDVIIFIDSLHHFENHSLREINDIAYELLNENGIIIILEPNLLNPTMTLLHAIDTNERGLLRLGLAKKYKLLFRNFQIKKVGYSAIVIGPDHPLVVFLAQILDRIKVELFRSVLLPKIYLILTKKKR